MKNNMNIEKKLERIAKYGTVHITIGSALKSGMMITFYNGGEKRELRDADIATTIDRAYNLCVAKSA